MFKYFTKADGQSVAINPLHVMSIVEHQPSRQHQKEVALSLTDGQLVFIKESYLEVVSALSAI